MKTKSKPKSIETQRKRRKRRFLGLLSQDRPLLFRHRKCWRIVTTPKTSVSSASSAFHGFKVLFAFIRVHSRLKTFWLQSSSMSATTIAAPSHARRPGRMILRVFLYLVLLIVLLIEGSSIWLYISAHAYLPQLDVSIALTHYTTPVYYVRD